MLVCFAIDMGFALANNRVYLAPHIGHMYTMVIADILKRWQVLLGNTDAQLLTGTDEHGMKVHGGKPWSNDSG